MKRLATFLFGVVMLSQLGATECGQVLRDPGFDLWCGEELCAWKVTRGEIVRVPTWHEEDAGVELVGTDVAIQQLSPVDSGDGQCRDTPDGGSECTYPDDVCLEFSLLSAIDDDAVVDLNVDVFGDGTIDHTQRLPIGNWQRVAYKLVVRMPFAGIRFELAKSGKGSAKLANIGAELARNCDGLPVIDPRPAPLGSPCDDNADCTSGLCTMSPTVIPFPGAGSFLYGTKVCVACSAQQSCGGSDVCGTGDPLSAVHAVPAACVPAASKVLGEQCLSPDECSSGICQVGMCSACRAGSTCANGKLCDQAWDTVPSPYVCGPGAGAAASGEPCVSHDDCASGSCLGEERSQCDDGRPCYSPAQCPFESGLKNGACTIVGIQGGVCQ